MRNRTILPIFITSTLSLTVNSAFANTPVNNEIEHIRINGHQNGLHQHTRGLNEEDIRNALGAVTDSAQLLSTLPGIHINAAGGLSGLPAIRGLADDRLRIQTDGMDLISSCPNHMNPPLSYLSPSSLADISVFTTVTPVSQGGDSIGGTISTTRKQPELVAPGENTTVSGDIGGYWRSNNQAQGIQANLNIAGETWGIRYSGNASKADNYRASAAFKNATATGRPEHSLRLDEVGSTAYKTQNHSLALRYQHQADELDLQINHQNMPYQLYPNQRMDLLDNEQLSINAAWRRQTTWGKVITRIYQEDVDHYMNFGDDKQFWYGSLAAMGMPCSPVRFTGDPEGTCAAGMPMYSESVLRAATTDIEWIKSHTDTLRFGAGIQLYTLDDYWTASGGGMGPGTFENIDNGRRNRLFMYVEREQKITPTVTANYGARAENIALSSGEVQGYATGENAPGMQYLQALMFNMGNRDDNQFNLDITAALNIKVSSEVSAEVGVSRKVRSPNLYEKYTWSSWMMAASMNNTVGDGNGYVGNTDLNAETAYSISASLLWQPQNSGAQYSLSPYFTYVDDYIDAVAATTMWNSGQFNVLTYNNQAARLFGVDANAQYQFNTANWGSFVVEGIVSITRAENTETDSGLYQTLPLHGNLAINHVSGPWQTQITWEFAAAKTNISEVRNEIETAGYGLLGLQTGYVTEQFRVDLGVENLLDKFYFDPTAGTYTGQGMTMSMNGIPFGIGVPGMGRSAFISGTLYF
ncbi:TonB-dependent receptor plug domain-containing protein [Alteromonas sp. AMM-1]|uniref:TonB-dependent receptor plug domain-containing protein n=1 Tax=Alteromonas sp. AMM-1 TaxID=3394233 RepID=UPI0039A6EDD5